jgi:hypothetical protein
MSLVSLMFRGPVPALSQSTGPPLRRSDQCDRRPALKARWLLRCSDLPPKVHSGRLRSQMPSYSIRLTRAPPIHRSHRWPTRAVHRQEACCVWDGVRPVINRIPRRMRGRPRAARTTPLRSFSVDRPFRSSPSGRSTRPGVLSADHPGRVHVGCLDGVT